MRRFILCMATLALGLCISGNKGRETKSNMDDFYPLTTYVVDVDIDNDIVTCVDFNGFLWEFDGVEDWMVNDICSMIMDNKGTPYIFDDEIIKVKNDGYIR